MEIKNQKYEDYLKTVADNSIDFVCIDPPYTDGKKDVLQGHKIHTKFSISHVVSEAFRVLKDNSFFAVFGQMPSIAVWHNEIEKAGFEWKQDITWVKRRNTAVYLPIIRQKELIYIYKKGNPKFNKIKGRYEDIKMPSYLHGLLTIDSLQMYISDLNKKFKKGFNRNENEKVNRGSNYNDISSKGYIQTSDRSPEFANFTNVWSFMPENNTSFGKNGINVKHPTVKPIKLIERLIELCTPEPTPKNKPIVLDYFLGSGTTAIASVNTNRDFKGCEMDKIYYETEIIPRVNKAIQNHNSDIFKSAEFGVLSCL